MCSTPCGCRRCAARRPRWTPCTRRPVASDSTGGCCSRRARRPSQRWRRTATSWRRPSGSRHRRGRRSTVAWDKRQTYQVAERLGIDVPRCWFPRSESDLSEIAFDGPVIIKPAIKEHFFYETGAKAWRANDPSRAAAEVPPRHGDHPGRGGDRPGAGSRRRRSTARLLRVRQGRRAGRVDDRRTTTSAPLRLRPRQHLRRDRRPAGAGGALPATAARDELLRPGRAGVQAGRAQRRRQAARRQRPNVGLPRPRRRGRRRLPHSPAPRPGGAAGAPLPRPRRSAVGPTDHRRAERPPRHRPPPTARSATTCAPCAGSTWARSGRPTIPCRCWPSSGSCHVSPCVAGSRQEGATCSRHRFPSSSANTCASRSRSTGP